MKVPAAEICARLDRHQLQAVLHNTPAGNREAGERGIGCHPDRGEEFRAGIAQAIAYATALGVPRVNVLAGRVPPGVDEQCLRRTFVANLRQAAQAFKQAGLVLLIEPINDIDIPGFYLTRTAQALDLLDEVGADNAFVQFVDNPGRHEPGTGELNWEFLFAHLDRIGYRGQVGAEYKPALTTEEGLGWLGRYAG